MFFLCPFYLELGTFAFWARSYVLECQLLGYSYLIFCYLGSYLSNCSYDDMPSSFLSLLRSSAASSFNYSWLILMTHFKAAPEHYITSAISIKNGLTWTLTGSYLIFGIFHLSLHKVAAIAVLLELFPQHKSCWSCRQLLYVTLFFISPLFLCLFNLEFQNLLLSVPSVLSSVLFCSLSFSSNSFLLFFLFQVLFSPCVYWLDFLISLLVFFSHLLSSLFSFLITPFCLLLPHALLLFNMFSLY